MSARTILMVALGLIAGIAVGYFVMSFFFLDHVTNRL